MLSRDGSTKVQYAPDGWLAEELKLLRSVRQKQPFLTIGLPPLQPWVDACYTTYPPSPKCASRPGLAVEFTSAVCDRLGITCEMKLLNWTTSMIEQYGHDPQAKLAEKIFGNEFDTSLPIFANDHTKKLSLSYTLPAFYAEDAVLMKTHFVFPDENTFLLKPFHPIVWLAILLTLLAVIFSDAACRFVLTCSQSRKSNRESCTKKLKKSSCCASYFKEVESTSCFQAGVLCQRNSNLDQPIIEWSRRVLIFTWGFASVLLCTTYSACLVSRRVAPEVQTSFKNLNEFGTYLMNGNVKLYAIGYDAYIFRQFDRWPKASEHLYENFRKAVAQKPPEYVKNFSHVMKEIEKNEPGTVFLYGSYITLKSLAGEYCNVSLIPLGRGQPLSYAFQKGNSYSKLFTKVILNFLEQGYYVERLQQKYSSYTRRCDYPSDSTAAAFYFDQQQQMNGANLQKVHTLSLQLIFWALLCGYMVGLLALMTEYFCNHKNEMEIENENEIETTRF